MQGHDKPTTKSAANSQRQLLDEWEKSQATRFTVEEVAVLKSVAKNYERWTWIASSLKTWAVWIVAIAAGYTVGLEALVKAVKRLAGN